MTALPVTWAIRVVVRLFLLQMWQIFMVANETLTLRRFYRSNRPKGILGAVFALYYRPADSLNYMHGNYH